VLLFVARATLHDVAPTPVEDLDLVEDYVESGVPDGEGHAHLDELEGEEGEEEEEELVGRTEGAPHGQVTLKVSVPPLFAMYPLPQPASLVFHTNHPHRPRPI